MTENEQGQLTEEQVKDLENLDAGSFDLDAFLDEKWEFPTFYATVYLDGATAAEIHRVEEAISKAEQAKTRKQRAAKRSEGELAGLAGSGRYATVEEDEQLERFEARRQVLADQFKTKSLKVVFQLAKPADEVHKDVEKLAKAKFPNVKDLSKDEAAEEYHGKLLMAQLVKGIYNYKGERFGGEVTVELMEKLYSKLVGSERQKLTQNMMLALSGGNIMQRAADAGFPR